MLADITNVFYEALAGLSADDVSGLFLLAIFAFLIYTFRCWYRGERQQLQHAAPSLLTTLGILGTFLGIAIGLVKFDVDAIGDSIPELLAGLKTAFITSIAGIVAGLSFKVITHLRPYREPEHAKHEVGPEDIHAEVRASRVATEKMGVEMLKLREEFIAELHEFAKKVSEMGSRHLIEALEQVIRDFNKNLTEQFGENFKRLDESVKKLVDWQEGYSEQVEKQTRQLQTAVDAIGRCEDALTQVAEATRVIPKHLDRQRSVIDALGTGTERLEALLKSYADMARSAREAIPAIDAHVREAVDQVAQAAKTAVAQHEKMRQDVQAALDEQRQTVQALFSGLDKQMREAIEKQDKLMEQRIQRLDDALQEELQRALQALANNLGGVTEKFSEDYARLTESMRRVVAAGTP